MTDRAALYARLPLGAADRWWTQLAREAPGGRVLELGAGTGRLTAALSATGAQVTAVEHDPAMLAFLDEHLTATLGDERAEQVVVVDADVAELPELAPAGLVALPAGLVNELGDPAARRAALAGAARCLAPGGAVAIELLGPWWLARLHGVSRGQLHPDDGGPPVGVEIEAGDLDAWSGRRHATLTYRFEDGAALTDHLDAVVLTSSELSRELADAGLRLVAAYGAHPPDDAPGVDDPRWHVLAARR